MRRTTALSIAESDPCAHVGVLADLRTFAALGAYGTAVLTTLTARGPRGNVGTHAVPADFVERQLRALVEDVQVDTIRIGMLATADVADAVASVLADHPHERVVLDPVLVRADGRRGAPDAVVSALRRLMLVTSLVTPNREEAARLLGEPVAVDVAEMFAQARRLRDAGAPRVLLKGGCVGGGDAVDVLVGPEGEELITAPWVDCSQAQSAGCVLSAAIGVVRVQSRSWLQAVTEAKQWVSATIRTSQPLAPPTPRGAPPAAGRAVAMPPAAPPVPPSPPVAPPSGVLRPAHEARRVEPTAV